MRRPTSRSDGGSEFRTAKRTPTPAWGNLRGQHSKTGHLRHPNRYRFQGRELDATLALYYYRYRLYDPIHRRFLTPDMDIRFDRFGPASYIAFGNRALHKLDPMGLYDIETVEKALASNNPVLFQYYVMKYKRVRSADLSRTGWGSVLDLFGKRQYIYDDSLLILDESLSNTDALDVLRAELTLKHSHMVAKLMGQAESRLSGLEDEISALSEALSDFDGRLLDATDRWDQDRRSGKRTPHGFAIRADAKEAARGTSYYQKRQKLIALQEQYNRAKKHYDRAKLAINLVTAVGEIRYRQSVADHVNEQLTRTDHTITTDELLVDWRNFSWAMSKAELVVKLLPEQMEDLAMIPFEGVRQLDDDMRGLAQQLSATAKFVDEVNSGNFNLGDRDAARYHRLYADPQVGFDRWTE